MPTIRKPIDYVDDIPVKLQLVEIEKYPLHNHSDLQIIYVLEGDLDLRMTFAHYNLSSGNIHIIHNDDVHSITKISDHNLLLILSINIDYFSNYFPELGNTVFTTKISDTSYSYANHLLLRDQIFSIVHEQYNQEKGYTDRLVDNTLSLLTTLINHFRGFAVRNEHRIFEHSTSHDLLQVDRISRITSYIYMNYPYKLRLSEIADKEKINVYYLSHLFQKYTGISFRSFLSMARAEMSEAQLLSTNDSISKIAQDVGFSDAKYYVENFISWFGHHPKEYRNLFSQKTIAHLSPVYQEYPLSKLKNSIDIHTDYPVFNDKENATVLIDLDFDQEQIGTIKGIKPISQLFNELSFLSEDTIMPEKYYEMNPQKSCIAVASDFIEHRKLDNDLLTVIDDRSQFNGLFAINGLKKPLYHFIVMLEKFPTNIVASGSNHMMTKSDTMYCILVLNSSETKPSLFTFDLRNVPASLKITKKHMRAQNTYASYWSQLNFRTDISQEEFHTIERMSSPSVSYEILSVTENHKLNLTLEPLDLVMITIEKI